MAKTGVSLIVKSRRTTSYRAVAQGISGLKLLAYIKVL